MFEVTQISDGVRIEMSATLENIDEAEPVAISLLQSAGGAVDAFAIRILLREALLNAVTHGSSSDPANTVVCSLQVLEDGFRMVITDDGPGFAWRKQALEMDVEGDGGRGLPLMRIYATRVTFNDKGNALELWRARDNSPVTAGTEKEVCQ